MRLTRFSWPGGTAGSCMPTRPRASCLGMRGTFFPAQDLAPGGFVVLDVEDTGCGMSPETLARIFDPFFTTKQQGIGMGLAISRTIIEAHDGRLWATPADGGGSCFHFTIPVANPVLP